VYEPHTWTNLGAIFLPGAHYGLTRKSKNSIWKRTFKSKRTRSWCVEMSDLSNDTKKTYHKISWDYPLKIPERCCYTTRALQNLIVSEDFVLILFTCFSQPPPPPDFICMLFMLLTVFVLPTLKTPVISGFKKGPQHTTAYLKEKKKKLVYLFLCWK
jgi:hypothetical protein